MARAGEVQVCVFVSLCLSVCMYIYIFMVCPFFCFLFFTILQQEWRTSCCIVVEHILDYLVEMTLKTPSTRTQKRQVAILYEAVSSIAWTINWLLLLLMGTKMNVLVSVSKLCVKIFFFIFHFSILSLCLFVFHKTTYWVTTLQIEILQC